MNLFSRRFSAVRIFANVRKSLPERWRGLLLISKFSKKAEKSGDNNDITTIKRLLNLALSDSTVENHKAAVELSHFAEKGQFSPDSFAPLSHALCRLLPSGNRSCAAYAAKSVKFLAFDINFRHMAAASRLPMVLIESLKYWNEEPPCLRELLAALQTLSCDEHMASSLVDAGLIDPLLEIFNLGKDNDIEIRTLAAAICANILALCDTVFLTNVACIDSFFDAMEGFLKVVNNSRSPSSLKLYCAASIANGANHPVLAARLHVLKASNVLRDAANQAAKNESIENGKLSHFWRKRVEISREISLKDCADGVDLLLGPAPNEDLELGLLEKKYAFSWRQDLVRSPIRVPRRRKNVLRLCLLCIWIVIMLTLLRPMLGSPASEV